VFVLLSKGRIDAAERLARRAIVRFADAEAASKLHSLAPALSVPESEDRLLRVLARIKLGEMDPARLLAESKGLKAKVWPA
jgi:hypothetical protein